MQNKTRPKTNLLLIDKLAWMGLALLVLFFLMLKSFSLKWQIGDENIYLYMSWALLDHGALPYHDYFFAHPLLHLFPGALVFAVFGFNPVSARIIPVVASLVSALFLFLLLRNRTGRVGALCTAASYLFAFSVLRASSHWTGVNLTVMWIVIGLFALLNRRFILAGVILALSVNTANYALPAFAMCALMAFLHSRRSGLCYLQGFFAVWSALGLLGLALGGMNYIDGVYRYHFLKSNQPSASVNMFFRVLTDNYWLHLSALLAFALSLLEVKHSLRWNRTDPIPKRIWVFWRSLLWESQQRSLAWLGFLWALAYLLFISLLPRVFPFYFLPMFVGLALCVAYLAEFVRARIVPLAPIRLRSHGPIALLVIVVIAAYGSRVWLQRSLLPKYNRPLAVVMKWSDSPLPVNSLFRWCCWDDVAQPNTTYSTLQEYLYHESRFFEIAPQLARRVADMPPQQTLFGDSSAAGLIAILADRALARDFADTNQLRFTSGMSDPQESIEIVTKQNLGAVLVRAQTVLRRNTPIGFRYKNFASLPGFAIWLQRDFRVAHRLVDRTKGTFLLLVPKENF